MMRLPDNEDAEFPGLHVAFGRIWTLVRGMRGDYMRVRAITALALTIAARSLNVMMPFMFAGIVNTLVRDPKGQSRAGAVGHGGLDRGALRHGRRAEYPRRDLLACFAGGAAPRRHARVRARAYALCSFHQTKRTGAVYRHIERGVRAMDFLLRFLGFNIAPTVYELALAAVMVSIKYGLEFALIAALTGVAFSVHTYRVTNGA